MYCRHCGTQLPDSARFCANCGKACGEAELAKSPHSVKRNRWLLLIIVAVAALLLILMLTMVFRDRGAVTVQDSRNAQREEEEDGRPQVASEKAESESDQTSYFAANPTAYFDESILLDVKCTEQYTVFSLGMTGTEEERAKLCETAAAYAALLQQAPYNLTLAAEETDDIESAYYFQAPVSGLQDLADLDRDNGNYSGCHACVDLLNFDANDTCILLIYISADVVIEDFSPPDSPEESDSSEPEPVSQPEPVDSVAAAIDSDGPVLPDLGVYLQCGRGEDFAAYDGWLVSYSFDLDTGKGVVDNVLNLMLEEQYQLKLSDTTHEDYTSAAASVYDSYIYSYTGGVSLSPVNMKNESFDVRLSVAYYYDQGRIGMTLYFSKDFTLADPGKQLKNPPEDFSGNPVSGSVSASGGGNSNVAEFARPDCNICKGDGDCTVCDGRGYLYSSASGEYDRNCWKCNTRGDCTYCNGTGKR